MRHIIRLNAILWFAIGCFVMRAYGGALREIGETREGKRDNLYRIGDRPDLMTMEVTVTSPRLPAPLLYSLESHRL